ncbi:hypothetical protein P879_04781 [Paragonimus westermani]|uniref:Uncharacterized protein n=1 Tax=Paragonimus westermani TaxID=34504 RepID=A0A8T0DX15_9TREM|nr:hypothetical protein P879_04781 [Paragonimus westermani]
MAVHNLTQVESHVVTKQFKVVGLEESHSGSDGKSCNSSSPEDDLDFDGKYDKAFIRRCIDQTRHMTVAEVRESLKQLADKLTECKPVNQLEARPPLAISSGHGDLQTQLEHIHRHLLEYTRRDPDLSNAIGQVRIGKVSTR